MEGPREVYRDGRGNTFKATAEYAALRGWTRAEPEPQAKARGQAANKARTVRSRVVGSTEQLQADSVEPQGEQLSDEDRATITASSGELRPDQAENK